jgi:hypothetical protein
MTRFAQGDAEATQEVKRQLWRNRRVTPQQVLTHATLLAFDRAKDIDARVHALRRRRDRLVRDMMRRRKDFAQRARAVMDLEHPSGPLAEIRHRGPAAPVPQYGGDYGE